MSLDKLIRKLFPALVALLLASSAYFQASGMMQWIGASALVVDSAELIAAGARRSSVANPSRRVRSAQAILERNFFDHKTDLLAKPKRKPAPSEPLPNRLDLSEPLAAAPCQGVSVTITTESSDPSWSLAMIKTPGEERATLRRVNDRAGGFEVVHIGFNPAHASPSVWLVKDASLCQTLLFGAHASPAQAEPSTLLASAVPAVPKLTGTSGLPAGIADKIEKVSATEFNLDRSVVDHILENQTLLMRAVRIVPDKTGTRLLGVGSDSLLGTLGLENGDRLETINGFNMASPEQALNAYARLRSANRLSVKVTRAGQPVSIELNIK